MDRELHARVSVGLAKNLLANLSTRLGCMMDPTSAHHVPCPRELRKKALERMAMTWKDIEELLE